MDVTTTIRGAALAVLLTAIASASTLNCSVNDTEFSCGGLTFSNFQTVNEDGGAGGVSLESATYDTSTGVVNFVIDPKLGGSQDEGFMFEVTGGTDKISLGVGGTGASVDETVCSAPLATAGPLAYLCPNNTLLANIDAYSGELNQPVQSPGFVVSSPIYIYKDLLTGSGGQLTLVDEGFTVTPEPYGFVLMGIGLAFLLLARQLQKQEKD